MKTQNVRVLKKPLKNTLTPEHLYTSTPRHNVVVICFLVVLSITSTSFFILLLSLLQ